MASKKIETVLCEEDWYAAGKQYLREDGIPFTFQDYFESRLRGDDKDHTVCECGRPLKPSQDSFWSYLSHKYCVPGYMWNLWMAEYKSRMSSTPGSGKGSKVREKQERAKKEATVEGAIERNEGERQISLKRPRRLGRHVLATRPRGPLS